MLEAFPPRALRDFCAELGEPTFVGSSGRVFPKSFKASPLLRTWLRRLARSGIELKTRHAFLGWRDDGALRLATPDGEAAVAADAVVLALGGGSWPRLGSDGAWAATLAQAGVAVRPLRPANCGFAVGWSEHFAARFAGAPLKPLALRFGAETARGEAVVARYGLEGGAVYALAAPLRDAIEREGAATLVLDLRPDVAQEALGKALAAPRGGQSTSTFLRKAARLSPVAIALLREAGPPPADAGALAARIKALPLRLAGVAPLARAISSAGGVTFAALDERLMLRARPGVFCCGEMLDWEAPTGGYLLQATFATGVAAARGALGWMSER
jgi:uncharacterized flavoprotein (TIGR03862 family)